MKTLILNISFVAIFLQLSAQFEIRINETLLVSKLSGSTYIVTHYLPWESNSMLLVNSNNDVLLIDTPYDSTATAILLNWIQKEINPKKILAINTGFHIDNIGGNAHLRYMGIDIHGADRTATLIETRGKETQNQIITWLKPEQDSIKKIYESMRFIKPNILYPINEGLILKYGDMNIEVFYPGETHSPDNVVVYVKESGILFAGCMVKALGYNNLGFVADANVNKWAGALQKVLSRFPETQLVIPHHGMWGGTELIKHTIELIDNK